MIKAQRNKESNLSWAEELMRWHNQHPEYKPFTEDSDSQRRINAKESY